MDTPTNLPDSSNWSLERRSTMPTDKKLFSDTLDLLSHLPANVRPVLLAQAFPRIANELRRLWPNTVALSTYVDALLVDTRGKRQGFTPEIALELNMLRAYISLRQDAPGKSAS